MVEKEIVKPKRKRKISEPEETPIVEKAGKSRKSAEKKVELKDLEVDPIGETKPAKKTAGKKAAPKAAKKNLSVENALSETPPPLAASAEGLAETVQAVKDEKDDLAAQEAKPRKRVTRAKKLPATATSDSVIKKTVSKAKEKTVTREIQSAGLEVNSPSLETEKKTPAEEVEAADLAPKKEESPIFKQLAEPELPPLPEENRARLQMQSPNRIFLYWSIKHNPFETLQRAFAGRAQNYTLTAKLINLTNKTEELFPVGNASGSWWFNVNPNTAYRIELGFSAPARPFVRLMYSNTVETPRLAPSPNTDWSTDFTVSAKQFAEVLDASGYTQDAFDVAIVGDDRQASDTATQDTFFQLTGERNSDGDSDELRFVLFVLASGGSLESLRGRISASLFAQLEAIIRENAERLSAERVLAALHDNFAFEDEGEEFLTPVFGASSINFPKKIRRPKFSPINSLHPVTSR